MEAACLVLDGVGPCPIPAPSPGLSLREQMADIWCSYFGSCFILGEWGVCLRAAA